MTATFRRGIAWHFRVANHSRRTSSVTSLNIVFLHEINQEPDRAYRAT